MMLYCKSCKCMSDFKLEDSTNKVLCVECGTERTDVTVFIKNSMRSNKEFIVDRQPNKFGVLCKNCSKKTEPILKEHKRSSQYCCQHCGAQLQLTEQFIRMMNS